MITTVLYVGRVERARECKSLYTHSVVGIGLNNALPVLHWLYLEVREIPLARYIHERTAIKSIGRF